MAEKIDYDFKVTVLDHNEFYKLFLSGPKDQDGIKRQAINHYYDEIMGIIKNKKAWLRRLTAKKPTIKIYAVLHTFNDTGKTGFMMFIDLRKDKQSSLINEMLKITPCHLVDDVAHIYLTEAKPLIMMHAN